MRTYKRKSNRGSTPKDVIDRACQQVVFDKISINSTAKEFAIPYKTLGKYEEKIGNKSWIIDVRNNFGEHWLQKKHTNIQQRRRACFSLETYLKKAAEDRRFFIYFIMAIHLMKHESSYMNLQKKKRCRTHGTQNWSLVKIG